MFGFLKKKLKEAVENFSKKTEEEADIIEEAEIVEKEPVPKKTQKEEEDIRKEEKKRIEKEEEKHHERHKETIEIKTPEERGQIYDIAADKEKDKGVDKEKSEKTETEQNEDNISVHEEETPEDISDIKEEDKKEAPEKRGFLSKIFGKKEEHEPILETDHAEKEPEKPKGLFGKITESVTKVSLSEKKFDELFWDLELIMLENNVAVEVIEKIKSDLKKDIVEAKIPRHEIDKYVFRSLKKSIEGLFDVEDIELIDEIKKKKPYIIAIIGINGSGKTTSLAKIIHLLKKNGLSPVVAACDTFRAAAIQQLEEHTTKLEVKLIKQDYGSDPAAIAYDAVEHAKAKKKDVVLIDTAGRLHSDKNLMQELEKIIKVAKPDLKIYVGESIAGNDVVEQVTYFNEKVGIDAIILSKADIDEKGGAAISATYITGKPILYLGVGQEYDDLIRFDKKKLIEQLGL